MMLGIARRAENPISFWEFTRKGSVVTVMSIAYRRSTCGCATSFGLRRIHVDRADVLLIAFCIQGLVKFAVGFAVPYRTRIARIAPTIAATVESSASTTASPSIIIVALVVLLFLTEMQPVSFITASSPGC